MYISTAVNKFTKEDLDDLLTVSRTKNAEFGITGLLILKDYVIIQYIEGDKKHIKQLYENIKKDTRHVNVTLLKEEPIEQKLFENWSMGVKYYEHLEGVELEYIKNFDFEDLDNIPDIFKKLINN